MLRPTQGMAALLQQDVPHGPALSQQFPQICWSVEASPLRMLCFRVHFLPERFGRAVQSGLPLCGLLLKPCQGCSRGSSSAAVATFSPRPPLLSWQGAHPDPAVLHPGILLLSSSQAEQREQTLLAVSAQGSEARSSALFVTSVLLLPEET